MDIQYILVGLLIAFAITVVLYLATRPRRSVNKYHAHNGGRTGMHQTAARLAASDESRWDACPGPVRLSARDLERVNIKRKLEGRRPLTRGGFTYGLVNAPPQYQSSNDFLMWLLIYESVQPSHYTHRCAVDSGITVQPSEPFNGLGGSYGGAGASGKWDHEDTYVTDRFHNPQPDDRNTAEADPTPTCAPDPVSVTSHHVGSSQPIAADTYTSSAPDPSPSYSSSSSDSSPSSSSDSSPPSSD